MSLAFFFPSKKAFRLIWFVDGEFILWPDLWRHLGLVWNWYFSEAEKFLCSFDVKKRCVNKSKSEFYLHVIVFGIKHWSKIFCNVIFSCLFLWKYISLSNLLMNNDGSIIHWTLKYWNLIISKILWKWPFLYQNTTLVYTALQLLNFVKYHTPRVKFKFFEIHFRLPFNFELHRIYELLSKLRIMNLCILLRHFMVLDIDSHGSARDTLSLNTWMCFWDSCLSFLLFSQTWIWKNLCSL